MEHDEHDTDRKPHSTIPEHPEPESPVVSAKDQYERDPRLAQFAADFLRGDHQGLSSQPEEEQQQQRPQQEPHWKTQPKPEPQSEPQSEPHSGPQSEPQPKPQPKPAPVLDQEPPQSQPDQQCKTNEDEGGSEWMEDERIKHPNPEKKNSSESRTLRNSSYNSPSLDERSSNYEGYKPLTPRERELSMRKEDESAIQEAEHRASFVPQNEESSSRRHSSSQFPREPGDKDSNPDINPVKEQAAHLAPVNREEETTFITRCFMKVKNLGIIARWLVYILPVFFIILVPLLIGAIPYHNASIGGVNLMWFCIWLEIVWFCLWIGRILAKLIPFAVIIIASFFTYEAKKWGEMARRLEMPFTMFFWWLGIEISFLPTMKHHHSNGNPTIQPWETTVNRLIIVALSMMALFLVEKILIRFIAVAFHMRTYSDRIEVNRFQIGSLTKLYSFSKRVMESPEQMLEKEKMSRRNLHNNRQTSATGDFTPRNFIKSGRPQQVVLALLQTTTGSHVLARRVYRAFVPEDSDTIRSENFQEAFDSPEELEAAFSVFDKEMHGDIAIDELENVCVEVGRERRSILASLKDLDSVVSELDSVLTFVVLVLTLIIFLCLISQKTAGVLTTTGSTILGLSWLFSATAQEFLQSIVFVFAKHPFDVGDRITVYGNTGVKNTGDDYFVKKVSLLFTEFKKMEGHVVQAPNSYLNQLFLLNHRRSGNLAETVPIYIRFGTTMEQMEELRARLLDFVRMEKREYYPNILTELRSVDFAFSITLNVIFFYRSSWQDELFRLKRRNKFICHMMMTLMDLGIESPVKNFPGARMEAPWYMATAQSQPLSTMGSFAPTPGTYDQGDSRKEGANQSTYDDTSTTAEAQRTQSQHRPSMGAPSMSRQSSNARSKKPVDYSLGMQSAIESGGAPERNEAGEDSKHRRLTTMVRSLNRAEDARSRRPQRSPDRQRSAAAQPPRPTAANIGDLESGQAFGSADPIPINEPGDVNEGQSQVHPPQSRDRGQSVGQIPPTQTDFRQPNLQGNDNIPIEQAVSPRDQPATRGRSDSMRSGPSQP